jgi:sugar (pentulose or hexulose) kinase
MAEHLLGIDVGTTGLKAMLFELDASGAFLGIRHWHTREDMLRSVLEGVALNIANCYDLLEECSKRYRIPLGKLRIGWAAAVSPYGTGSWPIASKDPFTS